MKLINLVTEGIVGNYTYDFTNKVAGCAALGETDKNALLTTLSVALFGAEEDRNSIKMPARAELKFSAGEEDYLLIRIFNEDGDEAVLSDADGKTVIAEGVDAVNAAVAEKLQLSEKAFKTLFYINKEDLANVLGGEAAAREGFLAVTLGDLTTAAEIAARYDKFKAEEAEITADLDAIKPVTRKEIKDYQLKVDSDKLAVDGVRGQIDEVNDLLAKAKEYDADTKEYYEQAAALESIGAKREDVTNKASVASVSREASQVKGVFEEYLRVKDDVAVAEKTVAEKREKLAALKKKAEDGAESAKGLEKDVIYYTEKTKELDKALRELIRKVGANPQEYKVKDVIDSYYYDVDKKLEGLVARKNDVDTEIAALQASAQELKAKKKDLRATADYKKAVADGALLETQRKILGDRIKESNSYLEGYEQRNTDLAAEDKRLKDLLDKLTAEQDALNKEIVGKFATHEDAVNSDVIIKQAMYAKHLVVSANEVELIAVEKKIDAVKDSGAYYEEKLKITNARREEIEAHLQKLVLRKQLQDEKLLEYKSYNRFKDIAEDLEYGSRCPVCEGFITTKKEFAVRNTRPLEEQIAAIQAEIDNTEAALNAINENIGQFTAAKTVSDQYCASLKETADTKRANIANILKEYGAKDVQDLFNMLKALIEKSKQLTYNLDKYHANEIELAKLQESYALIHGDLTKLNDVVVPEEKQSLASYGEQYRAASEQYEKLQPVLNGANATELLLKQQVVDKEYETIEDELESKEERLATVNAERDELDKAITLLAARAVKVEVDGQSLDYAQIVTKAVACDLGTLLTGMDESDAQKDISAARLLGVRKVSAKAKEEAVVLGEEVAADEATLEAAEITATEIYKRYEAQIAALGVKTAEELNALILDDTTMEAYMKEVYEYDESIVRLSELIAKVQNDMAKNQDAFDNRAANEAKLADLRKDEAAAILTLSASEAVKDDMIARYEAIIAANRKLSFVQKRIKGIDDCASAISENAIIAKDFATLVLNKASAVISNLSKDKYKSEVKGDGEVVLFNNVKGKECGGDKCTREESKFLTVGLAAAYTEMIAALLGTETFGAVTIAADECDKQSLAITLEAAKDLDLIAVPVDEPAFLKGASKL